MFFLTLRRALDLSRNCFTLDTSSQCSHFRSAMGPLSSLQTLSLAHNKIQNDGFALVCGLVRDSLRNLRQLDVAFCFISSKGFPDLLALLDLATDHFAPPSEDDPAPADPSVGARVSQLEEIMFQQNLLSYALLQDLHASCEGRADLKVVLELPHLGIAYPLRYELRDFGIESYHL